MFRSRLVHVQEVSIFTREGSIEGVDVCPEMEPYTVATCLLYYINLWNSGSSLELDTASSLATYR
jgi:hypothetical protein